MFVASDKPATAAQQFDSHTHSCATTQQLDSGADGLRSVSPFRCKPFAVPVGGAASCGVVLRSVPLIDSQGNEAYHV